VVGLLFLAGVALYSPFRARLAYHWDSAEFTLAVTNYNVALSQPHPPGYFLYVMAGRVAYWLVGDAHAALVWLSILCGAVLAAVVFCLGTALFDRRAGLAAALFTLTSPQVWFHSGVALTYVVDALAVTLTVLVCWRAAAAGVSWRQAAGIGALVAAVAGIRQQSAPGLIVVLLLVFAAAGPARGRKLLIGLGTALLVGMAWFVPMIQMSGGWGSYLEAVRRFSQVVAVKSGISAGIDAMLWNLFFAALFCLNGLLLGAGLLVAGLLYRVGWVSPDRKTEWDGRHGRALVWLAGWVLPMLFIGVVLAYTDGPGHVFSYLPAFLLLAGVVTAQIQGAALRRTVVALVVAVNAFAFLAWPPAWDGVFFRTGATVRVLREHDTQLDRTVAAARAHARPEDTIILHAREYFLFGMRHFQLYLPEFTHYQLAPDRALVTPPGRPLLSVQEGQLRFVARLPPLEDYTVLLVVPPDRQLREYDGFLDWHGAVEVPGSDGTLYRLARRLKIHGKFPFPESLRGMH